ncbi:uncharacterized protein STEHIDRAFT_172009, partial [Stereum hirsutum FP-91666 SS1]|uniref:uncharacterized protein n=1 Tax=Stereum hirsutum (strain FP-91666) TaxID=721885 RepID=UPI000444A603
MLELSPSHPLFRRSGRWTQTSTGSLIASWSGASVSFTCRASSTSAVRIRMGALTQRKDRENGGTPMIACSVSGADGQRLVLTREPLCGDPVLTLLKESDLLRGVSKDGTLDVTITMIDWASVLELETIVFETADGDLPIVPASDAQALQVLFVGDSMLCGFTDGTRQIPNGCLDAFPYLFWRDLRSYLSLNIAVDVVALPGVTLVDHPDEHDKTTVVRGMAHKFFKAFPWDNDGLDQVIDSGRKPSVIVIALGTNDEAMGVSAEDFINTMRAFVTRLLVTDTSAHRVKHICFIHPFKDFGDVPETSLGPSFPKLLETLSRDFQHAQKDITLHSWDTGAVLLQEHTIDGIHPTVEGHRILGQELSRVLLPIVAGMSYGGVK